MQFSVLLLEVLPFKRTIFYILMSDNIVTQSAAFCKMEMHKSLISLWKICGIAFGP